MPKHPPAPRPGPAGGLLPAEEAARMLAAYLRIGELLHTPTHIVHQEAATQIEARTGLNLRPLLPPAPVAPLAPDDPLLAPKDLLPAEEAARMLAAYLRIGELLHTPTHIVHQEAATQIEARTGLNLRPLLPPAPVAPLAPDDPLLAPKDLLPAEEAARMLAAYLRIGELLHTPTHIVHQEAATQIEARTGLNLRPLLPPAPVAPLAPDDPLLAPKDLATVLGLPSTHVLNRHLESIGWQVKRIGGGWEPTPTGRPYARAHAAVFAHGSKPGYNWVWRRDAVRQALSSAGLLAS